MFAVYLDELSYQLGSARVGCAEGNTVVNNLKFADGICVFRPTVSGLQRLLNICGDYAAEIIFIVTKQDCLPKEVKLPALANVFLNGAWQ